MRRLKQLILRHSLSLVRYLQAGLGDAERQSILRSEIAALKADIRQTMPLNPVLSGFKAYAQTDEDGIIADILERVPQARKTRTLIEIGCGNGLENNTHYLMLQGYRGYWIDGAPDNVEHLERVLDLSRLKNPRLALDQTRLVRDNIGAALTRACTFIGTREPDLFSLDVDGNDIFLMEEALESVTPLVICVEYNAKFRPPVKAAIEYDPLHHWAEDDYQGASLQSFCELLSDYRIVACNLSGVNAFFVRTDVVDGFASYPVELLYQPPRHGLRFLSPGHPATLKWLRNALHGRSCPSAPIASG